MHSTIDSSKHKVHSVEKWIRNLAKCKQLILDWIISMYAWLR